MLILHLIFEKTTVMSISKVLKLALAVAAAVVISSCSNKKFHITGQISDAEDSVLYLENMSLNGPETVDSVKLTKDGAFNFSGKAPSAPDFYRLRIASQIINVAIDSTETINVKASYPTMSYQYDISGSDDNIKIKELALLQMDLQAKINAAINNPNTGIDSVQVAVNALVNNYKDNVKTNYIFQAPMKAYAYFALFQTYQVGYLQSLIFNPRANSDDVKVYAAVATSWDTFYPNAERGLNLHNIALEGMKDARIIRNEQANAQIEASKVKEAGLIDISLPDNHGKTRRLSDLKGRVVLLDFHAFATSESGKRIMALRDLYNKYHAQGLEIYQVSLDTDSHFWQTQTAALPWICVNDPNGQSAVAYNVSEVPTYFLIDKQNTLYKRDSQIQNLDAEIASLLK